MSADLTILCVTRVGRHTRPFIEQIADDARRTGAGLVLAVDAPVPPWMRDVGARVCRLASDGYLESALDDAVALCPEGYILRLDDDEILSGEALDWVGNGGYRAHDHWAFRRANLWPDAGRRIANEPLWPDLQTRLSTKAKSGGRQAIHAGSPFGTGEIAPGLIEHHKFLVRPRPEREALIERYDAVRAGAGAGFAAFSVPELFAGQLETTSL